MKKLYLGLECFMSKNLFVETKTSIDSESVLNNCEKVINDNDSVIESKQLPTFYDRYDLEDDLLSTGECDDMFTTDAFHANVHRRHGVPRQEMHNGYWNYYKGLKSNGDGTGKSALSFLMDKSDFPNRNETHRGRGFIAQIKDGSISMEQLKKHYAGFKNLLHVIKTKMKHYNYTRVSRKVKEDVRNDIQFAVNFVDRNGKSGNSRHNGSKESKHGSVVGREFAKAQDAAKKEETKKENEEKMEENKQFKAKIYDWGKRAVNRVLEQTPTALETCGVKRLEVNLVFGFSNVVLSCILHFAYNEAILMMKM